jgi:ribonuclease HI
MSKTLTLFTDGGSRGNPGPSALGAVLFDENGAVVEEIGEYLGVTTNNQAEYRAVVAGLQAALRHGATRVECKMDSLLIVKQMNREWKVKDPNIQPLVLQLHNLSVQIGTVTYTHVPRAQNAHADRLVNVVLDAETGRRKSGL